MVALVTWLCLMGTTLARIPQSRFGRIPSVYQGVHQLQHPTVLSLLKTRGGSDADEQDDSEEDFDDEEGVFEDFELGDDADDEFAEDTMVDRFIDAYKKTPPLTKSYLTASFIVTAFGYMFNRNQFPDVFLLDWKKTLTRGQLWRPFTTFFNFGPIGLSYLLTVQFVWTYMSTLERLHHRKPYDFWIMIGFGMMSMVFGYPILKLNARFLGHNLSTFLVYMWSRYHEGMEVKLFDLYSTRAELLPWFFLAQVRSLIPVSFTVSPILQTNISSSFISFSYHRPFFSRVNRQCWTFWGLCSGMCTTTAILWACFVHLRVLCDGIKKAIPLRRSENNTRRSHQILKYYKASLFLSTVVEAYSGMSTVLNDK